MKIEAYSALQSKNELLPLFEHAFWWPFNPTEFERTIKADPRLKDSPVGYVAIAEDHIVGFVGVMDIATRLSNGFEENVGGIWGVVTHPVHSRKGIFTSLMKRCHRYFREKQYRFSLLYTSKSLIAYEFYKKLNYKDILTCPAAYKVMGKPSREGRSGKKYIKLDWDQVLKIFDEATKYRTGFVIRDKQYGKMLETRKKIQSKKSVLSDHGYALLKEEQGNVTVGEIMSLTEGGFSRIISQIEKKARKAIIHNAVIDKKTLNIYRSHGYMILDESYDMLMAKQLSNITFTEAFSNKFYTANVDSF